jgi:tripartite ATP-independent transporter DctM subunit
MIPPSVLMVIYGFIAEESIGALLLAGFLPGLLEAFSYSLMLVIRFKLNPKLGPPMPKASLRERVNSLKGTRGMIVLIVIVMGGIYTGVCTPTEAAGLGAMGSLLLALPRLTRADFKDAMVETARTTSLIFAIVVGVLIYVHFLGFTDMPGALADSIVHLPLNRYIILILILLLYLVLGMFLDGIGMLLLTVPLLLPAIHALGFHPIVFGVLVVRMIEIGLITPPVGLNVYVLRGVSSRVSMGDIFRGCGWFVFVDVINVAILLAFPQIILIIPETMIR